VLVPTAEPPVDSRGDHLRVLIANEKLDRLGLPAAVVEGLGRKVIARSVSVKEVAATTARERPDVALVGPRCRRELRVRSQVRMTRRASSSSAGRGVVRIRISLPDGTFAITKIRVI
jgi:hypothetical protein